MGKGKKKGGKGRAVDSGGAGDATSGQSIQPEIQPSTSQVDESGDAANQKKSGKRSQPKTSRDGSKSAQSSRSESQGSSKTEDLSGDTGTSIVQQMHQQQHSQHPQQPSQQLHQQQQPLHPQQPSQQLHQQRHPLNPHQSSQQLHQQQHPQHPRKPSQQMHQQHPRKPSQQMHQQQQPLHPQQPSQQLHQQQHPRNPPGLKQTWGSPKHSADIISSPSTPQQPAFQKPADFPEHQVRGQHRQRAPGYPPGLSHQQRYQQRPPGFQRGLSGQQYQQGSPDFPYKQQLQQQYQQGSPGVQSSFSHQQQQSLQGPFQQPSQSVQAQQSQTSIQKKQDGATAKSQSAGSEKSSQESTASARSQSKPQKSISNTGAPSESAEKFTPKPIVRLQDQMAQMSMINKKQIKPGEKGRRIKIETNYLKLDLGKLTVAYHYDVDIVPDTPKKYLRSVMEEFRKKKFNRYHPAFDGRKNLYSPYVLVEEGKELFDEIKVIDEMNGKEKIFKVKVQYANSVDLTPLRNINMTTLSPQEALQCVEIVLRSAPSSKCIPAGRSFFTRPPQIIDLGEGVEMYHGFYQSVVRGWKPLLNVDVAHKAFPKEIGLVALTIELLSSYHYQLREDDLRAKELDMVQKKTLEKFLKTLRVVYEIRGQPGSKREYRVNGIKDCSRRTKFRPDNGPEITIEDYFALKKNYRLQFPLLPTVWVGNVQRKDPILLPAELCTLLPGQVVNRKMTENQTSAMIKNAATSTIIRKQKIMNSLQQTNHNADLCIKEFGFSIGGAFEQIQARVLDPPSLEYSNGVPIKPSKGVWRADNAQFLKGAEIKKWTIISTCGQVDMGRLADMIYNFGPKCGMSLFTKAETPFDIVRGRPPRFGDILNTFNNCSKNSYDLVFVIIPDSGPTYSDVKRAAELNIGCLTQCIKRSTLMRKLNPATVNNILLKVNSKLNGTNHSLRVRPDILSLPCMIMGADVTHPSPDSQNIPSVAAVTASHDPKAFCYNICCRLQSPKTEIITDLQEITKEQLMYFYKMNHSQKPQRIVFFRDGVSEGQFNEVLSQEVTAIRKACTSLEKDYNPSITFLVVQKRHHTRFFPMDKRDSDDRNFNVPAGTCVDTYITNPNLQDFYLVSHASIQGVAKPTKYCTLWDDNNMNNDEIEALTYHLCHLFTRCNRSVSYPAPTYYAHLAAARAKVYIEQMNLDLNRLDYEQKNIKILDCIRKNRPMFFV